jgi:hypothetical protein
MEHIARTLDVAFAQNNPEEELQISAPVDGDGPRGGVGGAVQADGSADHGTPFLALEPPAKRQHEEPALEALDEPRDIVVEVEPFCYEALPESYMRVCSMPQIVKDMLSPETVRLLLNGGELRLEASGRRPRRSARWALLVKYCSSWCPSH